MKSTLLSLLLSASVCACSSAPQFGTFLKRPDETFEALASDSSAKLAADYSIAGHSFALSYEPEDAFGAALDNSLRKQGFELHSGGGDSNTIALTFAVDELKDTSLMRVILYLGKRRLSRPYAQRGAALQPVGPWSATEVL